jgi:hypothetical protein
MKHLLNYCSFASFLWDKSAKIFKKIDGDRTIQVPIQAHVPSTDLDESTHGLPTTHPHDKLQ